jgi:IS4 transposase
MVRYRDPETGTVYDFLTSVTDLEPGLIAALYLARWRIEKVFDTVTGRIKTTHLGSKLSRSKSPTLGAVVM